MLGYIEYGKRSLALYAGKSEESDGAAFISTFPNIEQLNKFCKQCKIKVVSFHQWTMSI